MLEISSDILSPMVVKELRQELRMKSFAHFFVWPQVIMALALLMQGVAAGEAFESSTTSLFETLFWLTFILPLFLLQPRRASASFSKEEQSNSLELVLLSELSGWQTTLGKWLALAIQSLLFVVAGLPYISLRYFLGGVDLVASLKAVFFMFLGAQFLLAISLLMSAQNRKRRHVNPNVLILLLFFFFGGPLMMLWGPGSSPVKFSGMEDGLVLLLFTALAVYQLLVHASTYVSPVHEDNAGRARFALFATLFLGAVLLFTGVGSKELVWLLLCVTVLPAVVLWVPTLPHPLLAWKIRKGSELLVWLRSGGWPGGVLCAAAATFVLALVLVGSDALPLAKALQGWSMFIAALIVPRAILSFLAPARLRKFGPYLFVHVALLVLAALTLPFAGSDLTYVGVLSPVMLFVIFATHADAVSVDMAVLASVVMNTFALLFLVREFVALRRELRASNVTHGGGTDGG